MYTCQQVAVTRRLIENIKRALFLFTLAVTQMSDTQADVHDGKSPGIDGEGRGLWGERRFEEKVQQQSIPSLSTCESTCSEPQKA